MNNEKKRVPVDQANRQKVAGDFHTNFWVEAGAGTGKTSLLIRRLVNIITQTSVELPRIVAITFTEKAATEIKSRLREGLEEELEIVEEDKKERIDRALQVVDYAPISTIHSFAAGLLRERPVEAGIDPRFKVLDTAGLDDLTEQAWSDWFLAETKLKKSELSLAVRAGFTERHLKSLAMTLYKQRNQAFEGRLPGSSDAYTSTPKALLEEARQIASDLSSMATNCSDRNDQGYQQIEFFVQWVNDVLILPDEQLDQKIFDIPELKQKGNKKNWLPTDYCSEQKELCREYQDMRNHMLNQIKAGIMDKIIKWLVGFVDFLNIEKNSRSLLDFQDLLLKSRDLLKNNKEVRGYFQRRYSYLLVDEFQDTDPLQAEIIFFLAEIEPSADNWKKVEPAPGKLFIVGDPKQAIYRFRGADIEIYEEAREIVEKHGQFLEIIQNFRTVPSIIQWVNRSFVELIVPIPGKQYQPVYRELKPFRYTDKGLVNIIKIPEIDGGISELRKKEAEELANFILGAVNKWTIQSTKGDEEKILDWSDVGILFPATTDIDIFLDVFQAYGIPFLLDGGKQFYQRREVRYLVNLLKAIDNPYDEVAMVSTLRNYFGVKDEELLSAVQYKGGFNYLADQIPSIDQPEETYDDHYSQSNGLKEINRAIFFLNKARQNSRKMSLPAFLSLLMEEMGLYCLAAYQERGVQSAENLRKTVELARSLETGEPLTIRRFIRILNDGVVKGREETETLLSEKDTRAVQILTVHRSKGLEFNMVILANITTGGVSGREYFLYDRLTGYYALKGGPPGFSTGGYAEMLEEEHKRLEAEKRRLFYVAATRARDYLVIPIHEVKKASGFMDYMEIIREKGCISREMCQIIDATSTGNNCELNSHDGAKNSDDNMFAVNGTNSGKNQPDYDQPGANNLAVIYDKWCSRLEGTISKAAVPLQVLNAGNIVRDSSNLKELPKEDDNRQKDQASTDSSISGYTVPRGSGIGSAFHQVMEKINLTNTEGGRIQQLVSEAARYRGLTEGEEKELFRLIKKTMDHNIIKRAASFEHYREVPFTVSVEGNILEGLVDLLFVEKGEVVIVDYKTDDVKGDALEERFKKYSKQGLFYALAVQRATGLNVQEVHFLFIRQGEVRSIIKPHTIHGDVLISDIVNFGSRN